MMTLAGIALVFAFGAAMIGNNGYAILSVLAAGALLLMKYAP